MVLQMSPEYPPHKKHDHGGADSINSLGADGSIPEIDQQFFGHARLSIKVRAFNGQFIDSRFSANYCAHSKTSIVTLVMRRASA